MRVLTDLGAPCGELLRQRGEQVAVTESSAGGLISAALVSVPDSVARPEVSFRIPVSGLREDNIEGVRASLADLSVETHECERCLFVALAEGTCPTCQSALSATRRNNVRALRAMISALATGSSVSSAARR